MNDRHNTHTTPRTDAPRRRWRLSLWVLSAACLLFVGAALAALALVDDLTEKVEYRGMLALHAARKHSASYQAAGLPAYELHCSSCHGISGNGGRGPSLRRAATELSDHELMQTIRWGIRDRGMPSFERTLSHTQIRYVMGYLQGVGGALPAQSTRGDPARGESLFRERGGCLACHSLGAEGASFGPDLTNIGRQRGANYLRDKLTMPEADVATAYKPVLLQTSAGERISGLVVGEDTFSVQIRDSSNKLFTYQKRDLTDYRVESGKSFMPAFGSMFTATELEDLVTFLSRLGNQQ